MTDVTKELELTMQEVMESAFEEFLGEYELDVEGSLEDMLFEFFAEGFSYAVEDEDETDEEE